LYQIDIFTVILILPQTKRRIKMKTMKILIILFLITIFSCIAQANTIYVPSIYYPTIQAGIDGASNGDVVQVANGVYSGEGNINLDFHDKSIILESEGGPENCIIDCNYSFDPLGFSPPDVDVRGFYFHSGETLDSVVQGFTIREGGAGYGGGILCENSSPTIRNNIISGNYAEYGGGMYFGPGCSPELIGNTITGNIALNYYGTNFFSGYGGGIYFSFGSLPDITNNIINGNFSLLGGGAYFDINCSVNMMGNTINDNWAQSGGGIYLSSGCSSTIDNNTISGNYVNSGGDLNPPLAYEGGGIYCHSNSSLKVTNNNISNNSATNYGGGIFCLSDCSLEIYNNTISVNSVGSFGTLSGNFGGGGGITFYSSNSPILISSNAITGNTALGNNVYGGGIMFKGLNSSNQATIVKNNITGNSSEYIGGGLYCEGGSAIVTGNFIKNNSALSHGGGIACFSPTTITNLTIANNIIASNSASNQGGGLYSYYSLIKSLNNTITRNSSAYGGGLACSKGSILAIISTILWNDTPQEIYSDATSQVSNTITIYYSDVKGGQSGIVINNNDVLNWSFSNIDIDPQFVDSAGGNYHLKDNSPCIGAGTMTAEVPLNDVEGNLRPNPAGSNPDIGAYENQLAMQPRFIVLSPGWNLISLPVGKCFYQGINPPAQPGCVELVNVNQLGRNSLKDWFSSVLNPGDAWIMISGANSTMERALPDDVNSLDFMSPIYGYWIKIKDNVESASLSMEGLPLSTGCPIPLKQGWNLVGCPLTMGYYDEEPHPNIPWINNWIKVATPIAKHVFWSIDGNYRMIISEDGLYDPDLPGDVNSLHSIYGGAAYWIKMKQDDDLIYTPQSGN
jgi:predicted outer membrane repeat protein